MASTAALAVERQIPSRYLAFAARAGVSALLLLFIFSRVQWSALAGHLRAASAAWLIVAWLLFGVPIGLIAIRWQLLLQVQGVRVALSKVFAITCIGQFFNTFLLGATGGDVMRVVYIVREAPEAKGRAGLSILVDRALGFVVLAIMALLAASTEWRWFMSRGDLRRVVWILASIVFLSAAGVASLALIPLSELCARLGLPAGPRASIIAACISVRAFVRAPRVSGLAVGLTVAVHLANMAGGYCTARALALPVGFASMGVILAIVFFVIAVPVSASGHGLRESIFVLMFSLFAIDSSAALTYSMCYLGFVLGWSAACAPMYLVFKGRASTESFSG